MRIASIKLATVAALAAGAALAAPSPSGAATTCSFDPGANLLEVDMSANNDRADLSVAASGHIDVGNPSAIVCGGGDAQTVNNVDTIDVEQVNGANQTAQVFVNQSGAGGAFEPGATPESSGVSEIEFDIDLADGFDTVHMFPRTDPFSDHFRLGDLSGGASGVNLNAPEAGGPDGDDLELSGSVDSITVTLGFLETVSNTYDGSGGPEFTGPLTTLHMSGLGGADGPDTIIGGDRGGIYDGFGGDDTLMSTPANQFNETLRGGDDTDTLSYSRATSGVTIDLGMSVGQDTGGGGFDILDQTDFENLIGGPFGDTLTGTNTANRIVGAAGADSILALDGPDDVDVGGGGADMADCGAGSDHATADFQVDTLTNCEDVDLLGEPPPPPPPPPPSGNGDIDPPETTITDGPRKKTKKKKVTFGIVSDEPGSRFECALDEADFSPCTSPTTVKARKKGRHNFQARAIDLAGNTDESPDTHTWKRKKKKRR